MSFSINLGGTAGEVLAALENVTPPADSAQFDIVKRFIQDHVSHFPSTGLLSISGSGHHDGLSGSFNLSGSYTTPVVPLTPLPLAPPAV